jgi:hypothetical protein
LSVRAHLRHRLVRRHQAEHREREIVMAPAGVGDDTVEPPIARLPDFSHVAGAERGKVW